MGMLDGKVAVVTGSGGGIGREIALHMAQAGAKVIINDIGASLTGEGQSATPAQQTKAIIEQRGGQAEINTDSVSSGRAPARSSSRRWTISAVSTLS
ncbi:SDR family NAD(P)-dependent oxidoreductase [Dankookia sp. P2]|uniref:SDR family NAD(P)-dependent oxidoreductase n=1 Tax=Dankookia sp. P2 TaxID=3423955 RepID=UPI003D66EEED